MGSNGRSIDTGTAYGLKPPTYNTKLVEVGPGTPMGELMRRYWQLCVANYCSRQNFAIRHRTRSSAKHRAVPSPAIVDEAEHVTNK
jgi:hypothetical protein